MIPKDLDPEWFEKILASEKWILLGKIASGLAHDINNPVMVIQNYISLLLDDISELGQVELKKNDQYSQDFEEILTQCKDLTKITRSLLHFSHINTQKAHKFDPVSLLENALHLLSPIFAKYKIEVNFHYSEDREKYPVILDEIQQVFMIILENAVESINRKQSENLYGDISKKIEISLELEKCDNKSEFESNIIIRIRDNGIGISPENMQLIFTPFYTTNLDKSEKEDAPNYNASGLGLAFAQYLIQKLHGSISVNSKLYEYASFEIKIPIQPKVGTHHQEIVF